MRKRLCLKTCGIQMDYAILNNAIYTYFITTRCDKGEYLFLYFDETDLNTIAGQLSTSKKEILVTFKHTLSQNWTILLEDNHAIPNYFGLLALQSYAAFLMQRDNDFSENAFIPKLNELLGFPKSDTNRIESLFKSSQDSIWKAAKEHIKSLDFLTNIPKSSEKAYRYVKYPKSQALLRTEDLYKLAGYFQKINLQPSEPIGFEDFKAIFNRKSDYAKFLSNHAKKIFNAQEDLAMVYQQLFNFYQTWNGTTSSTVTPIEIEEKYAPLLLEFYKEEFTLYWRPTEQIISLKKVFSQLKKLHYECAYNKLILLKNIPQYPDEYSDTNHVRIGDKIVVLIDTSIHARLFGFLVKTEKPENHGNHAVILLTVTEKHLQSPLQKYIRKYPLRLTHGLRLGRHNDWLQGAGPNLMIDNSGDTIVWVNDEQQLIKNNHFSFRDYPTGTYSVKIKNYTRLNFRILNKPFNQSIRKEDFPMSWSIKNWNYQEEQTTNSIIGLQLSMEELENSNTNRMWIDTLLNRKKHQTNNLIIKALQNKTTKYECNRLRFRK